MLSLPTATSMVLVSAFAGAALASVQPVAEAQPAVAPRSAVQASDAGQAEAGDVAECIAQHRRGQEQRLAGELNAAQATFLTCAVDACPKPVQQDCTTWHQELESEIPTLIISVQNVAGQLINSPQVTLDGQELTAEQLQGPLRVDPGMHRLVVGARTYRGTSRELSVAPHSHQRMVQVQLQAMPLSDATVATSGARIPLASYVFGGVALAGFAAYAGFGIAGHMQLEDLKSRCVDEQSCAEARKDVPAGKRKYVIADVGLGVGITAAIAAGLFLYFDATAERDESTQATLHLDAGYLPGGGAVSIAGLF